MYQIFYNGRLAAKKLTKRGAQAYAFKICQEKGWNISDISIVKV